MGGRILEGSLDFDVLRLLTAAMDIGRPYVVSGEVPRERLTLLQNAFAAAVQDKAFLEVAKQRDMEVSLVTGQEAQELVTKALDAPKAAAEKAKATIK